MQEKEINEGAKRLHNWMESKNISIKDAAKLFEIDYSRVWHLLRAGVTPSLKIALEIEKATKGYVKPKSWLTLISQRKNR